MAHDEIFGIFVCIDCCIKGKVTPSSGWGSSSSESMICESCGNKRTCHLMSQSDLIKIKTEIRNSRIDLLGI
jgi:hypothetical protein